MPLVRALFAILLLLLAPPARAASAEVPADRWMEIDLYWFDPENIGRSTDTFWERYKGLYRGVSGYKGIVLNLGMTANYILTFSGDPDQVIALPKTSGQEIGHALRGQLEGHTAQRQQAWRERFAAPAVAQPIAYGRWTYRDLRRLTDRIRARAAREGIRNFRVAALAVGQDGTYGGPIAKAVTPKGA